MATLLRTENFLQALRQAGDDVERVRAVIEAEDAYVRRVRSTPGSYRTAFTKYRSAVKNATGLSDVAKSMVMTLLTVTKEEQDQLKADQKAGTVKRQKNNRPIHSVKAFIEKGEALLKANSYLDRIVGLAMLTGRRTSELVVSGEFEVDPLRPDTNLVFTGQLKTKDRPDVGPYSIPVLTSPLVIVDSVRQLRRERGDLARAYREVPEEERKAVTDKAHNRISTDLNVRVKKHVVGLLGEAEKTTPHDLRKAYAEIAYYLSDDRSVARPVFHSRVLGHEESLVSSMAYHGYYIEE